MVGLKNTLPVLKIKTMKVKLLKNHVLGKQGDIVNINFFRGKYLISEGIALEQKQTNTDTDKITDDGSNTKKRATRKSKTNAKS